MLLMGGPHQSCHHSGIESMCEVENDDDQTEEEKQHQLLGWFRTLLLCPLITEIT